MYLKKQLLNQRMLKTFYLKSNIFFHGVGKAGSVLGPAFLFLFFNESENYPLNGKCYDI